MATTRTALVTLVTVLLFVGNTAHAADDPKPVAPQDRLFPFYDDGKWGYCNRKGEVRIEPRFEWADDFHDGRARVHTSKGSAFIDEKGKSVFEFANDGEEDWARAFSDGLAAFSTKGKCGYFDRNGKIAIETKFDDARTFSEGLAAVNVGAKWIRQFPMARLGGGKWGFVDKTGKLLIPMQFDYVDYRGFSDGLALVGADDRYVFIDTKGKVALTPNKDYSVVPFFEGLARVEVRGDLKDMRCGFMDKTGKLTIKPQFTWAMHFSEGLAAVSVGSKWGYADRTGRMQIPLRFGSDDMTGDVAGSFAEGLAPVRIGKSWVFIDKQGKVVIERAKGPKGEIGPFNAVDGFKDGLARVHVGGEVAEVHDAPWFWRNGAWHYINAKGDVVRRYRPDGDGPFDGHLGDYWRNW
jgi:WG containing repeat